MAYDRRIRYCSSDECSSDLALGALHDAADDRIVPLGTVKALLQSPAVDDVADQVEDIAVDVIEEIEQQPVVASSRAEVDVGNPDRSIPTPGATRWSPGLVERGKHVE